MTARQRFGSLARSAAPLQCRSSLWDGSQIFRPPAWRSPGVAPMTFRWFSARLTSLWSSTFVSSVRAWSFLSFRKGQELHRQSAREDDYALWLHGAVEALARQRGRWRWWRVCGRRRRPACRQAGEPLEEVRRFRGLPQRAPGTEFVGYEAKSICPVGAKESPCQADKSSAIEPVSTG